MADFLFLMHRLDRAETGNWDGYIASLVAGGHMRGGSSLGGGICVTKSGEVVPVSDHIVGYMRIEAESLEVARDLLAGNPTYEAGWNGRNPRAGRGVEERILTTKSHYCPV